MTVLALRALGLGDLLTAVPALRGLAAAYPDHTRILAAPAALAPLVELIGPDSARVPARADRAIDAVRAMPAWVGGRTPELATAQRLPRGTIAVNLHGAGPESHRFLLATAPERLLAFAHPDVLETAGGPPWQPTNEDAEEHEVARWCRLLAANGIVCNPDALELPAPLSSGRDGRATQPRRRRDGAELTLLHPGAASAARRWPLERWAAVARAERRRGSVVVVTGSPSEAVLAGRIAAAAQLPPGAALAGRTDLRELARVVASATRVVSGDTGVAHLATAFRIPSVLLFGPTSPARWGPPASRPWHRVLWDGRRGDPHGTRTDPGLLTIEPADVLAALAALPPPVG